MEGVSWSANKIAAAISRQILQRKCIVLVDNCNWTGYECDILGVTTDRRIIDIEVKISRADLKADAKKTKWWEQNYLRNPDTGRFDRSKHHRDHPPKVWKHYYALPEEIWGDGLLDVLGSPASGVLLLSEDKYGRLLVSCKRRAKPARDAYRLGEQAVLDVARLANLRLWNAYETIDHLNARVSDLLDEQPPLGSTRWRVG